MNEAEAAKGIIFNVQHYSIHDGPGIRTTVFMKGCPLRCAWCQNPESQKLQPELFFNAEACTGCGKCVQVCPVKAIEIMEGKSKTNRNLCRGVGKCAEVCPNEARTLMGRVVTAGEVFKEVNGDSIFYQRSGGGVTLSGGDPVAQPEFSIGILKLCKDAGIHTAIETSGCVKWEILSRILDYVDLVLYDFKEMESAKHKIHTGVTNTMILDNVRKIYHERQIPLLARVPVVPGFNDSVDNISATARFVANELGKDVKVHLLPYHRLGETKYERLECVSSAAYIKPPTDEYMEKLKELVESFGLTVTIGG